MTQVPRSHWSSGAALLLMLVLSACMGTASDPASGGGASTGSGASEGGDKSGKGGTGSGGTAGTGGKTVPAMATGGSAGTGPAGTGGTAAACTPQPGATFMRRLSRVQYDNTVKDLVADDMPPGNTFPDDEGPVTLAHMEVFLAAAEGLADRATKDLTKLMGCNPQGATEATCVQSFLRTFGGRAYRRPLEDAELKTLTDAYTAAKTGADVKTGVQAVLQRIFLAPDFLYRIEVGEKPETGKTIVRLTPWEIASRLSYFLWGTLPDDTLSKAAASGALAQADEVGRQARRLLGDPRARQVAAQVHGKWLDLDGVDRMVKDPAVFKNYTPELRAAMRQSVDKFIDATVWEGEGTAAALLTSPVAYVNEVLAPVYGLTTIKGKDLQKVSLDPGQRLGLLTQAGVLAMTAKPTETSPVRRGVYIRERVMCSPLPPPLPNVAAMLPPPAVTTTTRERFTRHSSDAVCAACHKLIDPVGFGFENYDALGQWRTSENGKTVDASGELIETDVNGTFVGAVALARKLADSKEVRDCVTVQWFEQAFGRETADADACTLSQLGTQFAAANWKIPELIYLMTQTEAFSYRNTGGTP